MKAPEVPPLLVRASDQSPKRIAGRRWSEIGADPWVMRIVQWGYKIPFVTLLPLRLQGQETTCPKGSLKWSSLNQSVQELRNKGAIEPAPLTPQPLVPCPQGNRGVEADHRSVLPQCFRALPELHYGDASVNPRGPTTGPVVNVPRPERCLLSHIGINPADRRYLRFCHNGTAWQFTVLPFGLSTSPRVFTKILKPVLAYAHLHRVRLHMYIDDWLLNPGTH